MSSAVGSCRRDNCFAPDTACIDGVVGDYASCEYFNAPGDAGDTTDNEPARAALPWSGLALGAADLSAVAALGQARVVGLVGLSGAGKTTTLAATHLARRRGEGGIGTFAGSYTLLGWHRITRHLQWAPWGDGTFPPHTVLSDSRTPALLHMALRADSIHHLLYSDVPGEWFKSWAYDADAVPGVSWLVAHADAFLLFADSEALGGAQRGEARAHYAALAQRLHSVCGDRPVVCVRSKADVEVPQQMTETIERVNGELFRAETLLASAHQDHGRSLIEAVDQATAAALREKLPQALRLSRSGRDMLMAYRDPAFVA
ncbi:MAG: hypothetical protein M3340_03170 [Actinomycetota bacterium]|nr:hypothetical protein [Actinomycetota bacterium]